MNDMLDERFSTQRSEQLSRLNNGSMIDIDAISDSVIYVAECVASVLDDGLPKSIYQLKLFHLLAKKGFKLQIQMTELKESLGHDVAKEIIIVNGILVIECVVQDELVSDFQRRMMFDHDNDFVTGIIINFGDSRIENIVTKVYQNSVLH